MAGVIEIMKLSDVYAKIIKSEPYDDLSVFTFEYESYEEFPIVSRYKKVDYIKGVLTSEGVFEFLISLSCFVLRAAIIFAREKRRKASGPILFGISFTGFDDFDENSFVVPKIFVYPGGGGAEFLRNLIENRCMEESAEMSLIKRNFDKVGAISNFHFYESRFFDDACGEELVNIYAFPVEGYRT
ncbi:Imm15 family immunity protein [Achromobacter sp. NPDC058515]|uniref:Imm15 family immunity protein n=1 Tax=Achromobacter sp. NPDC058515 TaxID=3346533 RepID=UPI003654BD90